MKLYNIVKVYTSTVGTGTVTLGSAVPSFITFATAGVVNGSTVSYAIEDGNNREVGTGTYTSGAETLTRSVVTSTNSNNLITLSGNAVVFITGLAADLSSDTANVASTLIQRDGSGNFAAAAATLSSAVMKGSSSGSTTVQASATASGTLTLPAATDTLIGKATSDTLTNKTFDTAGAGNVFRINGTGITAVTGSGSVVLDTSPTITTPTITTSATVPLIIGGTGTTSTLTLRSTSGVGTTGADIIFQTGNNGATEVMRLQNGGNVGIGTPSPGAKLDVVGNLLLSGQSTAEQYVKIGYGRSGSGFSYIDLQGDTTYAYGTRLIRGNTGANAVSSLEHRGTGDLRIVNYEAAPICFYTGATEKARFDSDGNLAIGTTSTTTGKLIVAQTNYSVPGVYLNHPTATWGTTGQFNAYRYIQTNSAATDGNWRAFHVGAGGVAIGYSSTPIYGSSDALYVNGNVGIGTSSPATSAQLDISSTTGALLVPRMTTTQRDALTAANGMIIYNTTTNTMQGRINGAWADM